MELKKFEQLLGTNNAIRIDEEYILFNDLELYSFYKKKSIVFPRYKELYEYKINNKSIKDIINEKESFTFNYHGGRGSSSSNSSTMAGGFNHANERGRKSEFAERKFPAEFNVYGRNRSYENTLKRFRSKYVNEDTEYGIAVDELGYVHRHIKGNKSSVAIGGNKGQMVIHNHPSGGNFSDSDLISVSSTNEKGIVATGSNKTYSFVKTNKFKSKEFIKAVKKAKWPSNLDYDKGADWWLRKNSKDYGYKYSARK